MTVAVNQAGTPFTGSRGDQGVGEWKALRHFATDVEGRESHSSVDGNDLAQQFSVVFHRAASFFGSRPELP